MKKFKFLHKQIKDILLKIKFSMRGKYNTDKKLHVPGPGQYDNETQKHLFKSPSWRYYN